MLINIEKTPVVRRPVSPSRAPLTGPKPGDWYTPWFNSPLYHTLYRDRDHLEAQRLIDNLTRYLGIGSGHSVLDLGCGRGRHAVYLSRAGADVTGLDLSPESIDYARRFEHDRLRFEVGDMRDFLGYERYTEVLNLFTSFGYFRKEYDDLKVLHRVHTALKPGGVFVVDFMNVRRVIDSLVATETKHVSVTRFDIERRVEDGFIIKDIRANTGSEVRHYQERVRALKREHFLKYFQRTGFELVHLFGDYRLNPFDESTSDRLIMIVRKV